VNTDRQHIYVHSRQCVNIERLTLGLKVLFVDRMLTAVVNKLEGGFIRKRNYFAVSLIKSL
jgi:hypothetical protein